MNMFMGIALIVLACGVMLALIVGLIVAEIRTERYVRTPDPDPWVRRIRRW